MIYQLKYTDKDQALYHLKEVGVLDVEDNYTDITHAVVEVQPKTIVEATFDEEGNMLTPGELEEGYFVDVMSKVEIDFGVYVVTPANPRHAFAGHAVTE